MDIAISLLWSINMYYDIYENNINDIDDIDDKNNDDDDEYDVGIKVEILARLCYNMIY